MKTRSKLALIVACSAVAVAALAAPGLADPPDGLTSPPDHRHFIVSPDGDLVPVGPQICTTRVCNRRSTSSTTTCTTPKCRESVTSSRSAPRTVHQDCTTVTAPR